MNRNVRSSIGYPQDTTLELKTYISLKAKREKKIPYTNSNPKRTLVAIAILDKTDCEQMV